MRGTGIMLTMGLIDEVQDTLGSLDYVILILVLSAGALAFLSCTIDQH